MVKKKVQEFSFQEYLISKGCPKFEKAAIRDALTCWGDQTPCKEYDMEELVNAFEGCNKIKVTRENAKKNKDSQNDPEKPDRSMSKPLTIFHGGFQRTRLRKFRKARVFQQDRNGRFHVQVKMGVST